MSSLSTWIIAAVIAGLASILQSFMKSESGTITFNTLGFIIIFAAIALTLLVTQQISGESSYNNDEDDIDDSEKETGTVKWFNTSKGYGFITRQDGSDIFVHHRSIHGHGHGRRRLVEGQTVTFVEGSGDKGPQAEHVKPTR